MPSVRSEAGAEFDSDTRRFGLFRIHERRAGLQRIQMLSGVALSIRFFPRFIGRFHRVNSIAEFVGGAIEVTGMRRSWIELGVDDREIVLMGERLTVRVTPAPLAIVFRREERYPGTNGTASAR